MLADKWQMPAVATALLVQLEAALSPSDAVSLLKASTRYPDSVSRAALAAIASKPTSLDQLFKANPRFCAEI